MPPEKTLEPIYPNTSTEESIGTSGGEARAGADTGVGTAPGVEMDGLGGDLFRPGYAPHQAAANHLTPKVPSAAPVISVSTKTTALLGAKGVIGASAQADSAPEIATASASLKGVSVSAATTSFDTLSTKSSLEIGGLQPVAVVPSSTVPATQSTGLNSGGIAASNQTSGAVVIGPSVSTPLLNVSGTVTIDVERPSAGAAPRTVAKTVHSTNLNELKTTIASDVDGRVVDKTPSFALSDKQANSVQARFFARLEKELVREAMKKREGIDLGKPKERELTVNDRFKPPPWSNTIIDHYMANLARIIFLIMSMLERVLEKIFGKASRNPISERIRRLLAMGQQEKARQEAEKQEKEKLKELKKLMMQAKLVARK